MFVLSLKNKSCKIQRRFLQLSGRSKLSDQEDVVLSQQVKFCEKILRIIIDHNLDCARISIRRCAERLYTLLVREMVGDNFGNLGAVAVHILKRFHGIRKIKPAGTFHGQFAGQELRCVQFHRPVIDGDNGDSGVFLGHADNLLQDGTGASAVEIGVHIRLDKAKRIGHTPKWAVRNSFRSPSLSELKVTAPISSARARRRAFMSTTTGFYITVILIRRII